MRFTRFTRHPSPLPPDPAPVTRGSFGSPLPPDPIPAAGPGPDPVRSWDGEPARLSGSAAVSTGAR